MFIMNLIDVRVILQIFAQRHSLLNHIGENIFINIQISIGFQNGFSAFFPCSPHYDAIKRQYVCNRTEVMHLAAKRK